MCSPFRLVTRSFPQNFSKLTSSQNLDFLPASDHDALRRSILQYLHRSIATSAPASLAFSAASSSASTASAAEPFLSGTSSVYLEEMFEAWKQDPSTVHKSWDVYFRQVESGAVPGSAYTRPPTLAPIGSQVAVAPSPSQAAVSRNLFILKLNQIYLYI
jgi:hypothetical protein